MPFINVKTNASINQENELKIKAQLGEAIKLIGKSESWLMINFEDKQRMYFRGDNSSNMAFVQVDLYGAASSSAYNSMTGAITESLNKELGIEPDKIYVKYSEIKNWGFNGGNF